MLQQQQDNITLVQVLDGNSRLLSRTDDRGNTTTNEWDALDRRKRETFADGTFNAWVRDLDDNVRIFTDANGSTSLSMKHLLVILLAFGIPTLSRASIFPSPATFDGLDRPKTLSNLSGEPKQERPWHAPGWKPPGSPRRSVLGRGASQRS